MVAKRYPIQIVPTVIQRLPYCYPSVTNVHSDKRAVSQLPGYYVMWWLRGLIMCNRKTAVLNLTRTFPWNSRARRETFNFSLHFAGKNNYSCVLTSEQERNLIPVVLEKLLRIYIEGNKASGGLTFVDTVLFCILNCSVNSFSSGLHF